MAAATRARRTDTPTSTSHRPDPALLHFRLWRPYCPLTSASKPPSAWERKRRRDKLRLPSPNATNDSTRRTAGALPTRARCFGTHRPNWNRLLKWVSPTSRCLIGYCFDDAFLLMSFVALWFELVIEFWVLAIQKFRRTWWKIWWITIWANVKGYSRGSFLVKFFEKVWITFEILL